MMTPRAASPLLLAAVLAAASACASNAPRVRVLPPRPAADPGAVAAAEPAAAPSTAAPDIVSSGLALARTAETLLGRPYREGGALPDGFDCSGLVTYVFARHGIAVPRDVRRQSAAGWPVDREDLAPGDLVFFATTNSGPTHVGIAIGGGRFIHAPKSGDVVRVESLAMPYWAARLVAVRRIASDQVNRESESSPPRARVLPGPFPFVLG